MYAGNGGAGKRTLLAYDFPYPAIRLSGYPGSAKIVSGYPVSQCRHDKVRGKDLVSKCIWNRQRKTESLVCVVEGNPDLIRKVKSGTTGPILIWKPGFCLIWLIRRKPPGQPAWRAS